MSGLHKILCLSILGVVFIRTPGLSEGESAVSASPARLRFWGEFYNESVSSEKTGDNLTSFSHTRNGLRYIFNSRLSLESYWLIRYGKDMNKDFWNNRVESGLGLRLRYSHHIFLACYAEWIQGKYLNVPGIKPHTGRKRYRDFRTGLIFWYGWDTYSAPGEWVRFPLTWWGEIYSDISYFDRESRNVIGYGHLKTGCHMVRCRSSNLDVYGAFYLNRDINRDFWNNRIEIGPGLWIQPFDAVELKFYMEWLSGYYMGVEGHDPNPYPERYHDRRYGLLFWIGW